MSMYKLCFYVPVENAEAVKQAVFSAGAGKIGNYSQCSFDTLGQGQFMPNEKSKPTIGRALELENLAELKVELVSHKSLIKGAVQALLDAHPYEEVAYQVIPFLTLEDL